MDEQTLPYGVERQHEIFIAGLANIKPGIPASFEDLQQLAEKKMKPKPFGYVSGNAGAGDTALANRDCFKKWQIVPRFLRDISLRDLSVEVLGQKHPFPLFIAPVGVQGIIHADAELATARAANKLGVPMVLSTFSSTPMEEVAEALGDTPRWFQLYWPGNNDICLSFLSRAAAAGFSAIVVTLDTAHIGWREVDMQHAYNPFARGEGLANYMSDPVFKSLLSVPGKLLDAVAVKECIPLITNPRLNWNDLKFLREHTKLPIILKGVLHPDDARRAIDEGCAGVIVSNHGGRQVDGAIGALDALVDINKAVGDKIDLMFDSGIRRGADVCKAIALGARCAFVGRPYCYGLGIDGENGVESVLLNLLADVDLTLGLSGGTCMKDLRDLVVPRTR